MSGLLGTWLVDTFIYTSLLIAAVLLLRKPVGRAFGPQVAYALWALPFLRFVMPPILLPAWMAPAEPVAMAEPITVTISDIPAEVAAGSASAIARPELGIALIDLLLPLWLGGAAVFLVLRARQYIRMRRELLAEARPVGEVGKIRLVETPEVNAPLAFGITDKVVALPPFFMALHDREARDMAIAHELAHHRGRDLLANVAAQPLLALHWFNPLAWWGWQAMRKDQEAACDARVVSGQGKADRAAYAEVIAGFAAGSSFAMAAPMACPMLGEKTIIHRLRSLTMTEVSTGRRRIGIAAITTTALALPLTASIAYAEADAPESPATLAAGTASLAPSAPNALSDESPAEAPEVRIVRDIEEITEEDGQTVIELDREVDGERRVIRRVVRHDGPMSAQERTELMAEIEEELAEAREEIEEAMRESREARMEAMAEAREARREAMEDAREARAHALASGQHRVEWSCEDGKASSEVTAADGTTVTRICKAEILAGALEGLVEARKEIARDPEIPAETRKRILRELDESIANMRKESHQSAAMRLPAPPPAPNPPAPPRFTAVVQSTAWVPQRVVPAVSLRIGAKPVNLAPHAPEAEECPEAKAAAAFASREA